MYYGKGVFLTQDDERALALCPCKAQTRHQLFLAHLGRFVVLFLEVSHLSPPTGDGMRWLDAFLRIVMWCVVKYSWIG